MIRWSGESNFSNCSVIADSIVKRADLKDKAEYSATYIEFNEADNVEISQFRTLQLPPYKVLGLIKVPWILYRRPHVFFIVDKVEDPCFSVSLGADFVHQTGVPVNVWWVRRNCNEGPLQEPQK